MPEIDYQKQAQEYHGKIPLIILGSGASAAHGMSGMGALAKHLNESISASDLTDAEASAWDEFSDALKNGVDLERALYQVTLSETLTNRVVNSTWSLINTEDLMIFKKSLQDNDFFPLSSLFKHIFGSSTKRINVVTTNYDRLAEYACEQAGLHHYSGFTYGFFRQLSASQETTSARRVNIWKVHGSLDWFQSPLDDTVALSNIFEIPDNYKPQIVTPGTQKYQRTHLEPFRSIINYADTAINDAGAYLCIGYGFNDEHIQPKLISKCSRNKVPITIITYKISESIRKIITEGKMQNYLIIESGDSDDQSIVYSSLSNEPLRVEKNIWSLEGYLTLIT